MFLFNFCIENSWVSCYCFCLSALAHIVVLCPIKRVYLRGILEITLVEVVEMDMLINEEMLCMILDRIEWRKRILVWLSDENVILTSICEKCCFSLLEVYNARSDLSKDVLEMRKCSRLDASLPINHVSRCHL